MLISILHQDWETRYDLYIHNHSLIDPYVDLEYSDLGEFIISSTVGNYNTISNRPKIHWFHGTRVIDINSFKRNGILPLNEIYPRITETIDDIAKSMGIYKVPITTDLQKIRRELIDNKMSYSGDLGPCAMLLYDAVINAKSYGCHEYTIEPEIVRDYTELEYGDQSSKVLSEYIRVSKPAVVEFIEPTNAIDKADFDHIIGTVFTYLYYLHHNKSVDIMCNTCFTGNGKAVPPENIVSITLL